MLYTTETRADSNEQIGAKLTGLGNGVLRYGLAVVVGWIGMMKFTAYEANGIQPLVAHSPLLGLALPVPVSAGILCRLGSSRGLHRHYGRAATMVAESIRNR